MFSMFREESKEDGKPGAVSMWRVLAFILAVAAIGLFMGAFFFATNGWIVFIPGAACLIAASAFLILTTVTTPRALFRCGKPSRRNRGYYEWKD
jgi:hypothetical protein